MRNLTKIQKIVFLFMVALIVGLSALSYYLKFVDKPGASSTPTSIQELSCDELKTKLTDIYIDPSHSVTYTKVVIMEVNENSVTIKTGDGKLEVVTITSSTKYEKLTGQATSDGTKDDLKKDVKIEIIKTNPLREIEYVSYLGS